MTSIDKNVKDIDVLRRHINMMKAEIAQLTARVEDLEDDIVVLKTKE